MRRREFIGALAGGVGFVMPRNVAAQGARKRARKLRTVIFSDQRSKPTRAALWPR